MDSKYTFILFLFNTQKKMRPTACIKKMNSRPDNILSCWFIMLIVKQKRSKKRK